MPSESYKSYIKRMKGASSLKELEEILGEAIHDKSVPCGDHFDKVLLAMDEREKVLGVVREN